ncbi:hypothetical protein PsYK624_007260 [Phanerochaete sordida]|uniref:Uncharacterized protein n=1 Tax=Phanerochaete sordida TaxID=48140 RepID=A0A9P3FYH4_9APHY|nr:hypothetical protein PsYK624_007260 [Phanerochaete sordida]
MDIAAARPTAISDACSSACVRGPRCLLQRQRRVPHISQRQMTRKTGPRVRVAKQIPVASRPAAAPQARTPAAAPGGTAFVTPCTPVHTWGPRAAALRQQPGIFACLRAEDASGFGCFGRAQARRAGTRSGRQMQG